METIGSQKREKIEDTNYTVQFMDEHLVLSAHGVKRMEVGPDAVLLNKETGIAELWTQRDDFAGYVIEIDGIGYEFVRSLN